MPEYIYKICRREEWAAALELGRYKGSAVDQQDGFIHFSSRAQVHETASKHFAGQTDLVLLLVDPTSLGDQLKWEPSPHGMLFPHLYGALSLAAVKRAEPLPLDLQGQHILPELL